jgi:L-lysine exporter family protein LysE/ArgO
MLKPRASQSGEIPEIRPIFNPVDEEMTEALFFGVITGIIMSAMLGTVFFALIQNSIDNGYRTGILIAIGVIASDTILILLAVYNAELFPEDGLTEVFVRTGGSLFLVIYGIKSILRAKKINYPQTKQERTFKYISTGFALNILNPGNYIGWLSITTSVTSVYTFFHSILFYVGALIAIFFAELAIALGAANLKKYINQHVLKKIDVAAGILFILFGFALWYPYVF